jgi:SNF2 family DNA or RNA helicase
MPLHFLECCNPKRFGNSCCACSRCSLVNRYFEPLVLSGLVYAGTGKERAGLRTELRHRIDNHHNGNGNNGGGGGGGGGGGRHLVMIVSYRTYRQDHLLLQKIVPRWYWHVLDEGHFIQNTKTKIYKAVTQVTSRHRLVRDHTAALKRCFDVGSFW